MTDKVETTGTDGVIGVVISAGEITQVSVNDPALEGISVVIIEDDSANKLMRTGLDDQITAYMESAREKNAKRGTALVSELAGAHLLEISKMNFSSSQEMAQEMADALDHAIFLLNKAQSGDLPADEIQEAAASNQVGLATPQVVPAMGQLAPVTPEVEPAINQVELAAPEVAEQQNNQMVPQAAEGQRRSRLYPSW